VKPAKSAQRRGIAFDSGLRCATCPGVQPSLGCHIAALRIRAIVGIEHLFS
jgi:hypothetical protein